MLNVSVLGNFLFDWMEAVFFGGGGDWVLFFVLLSALRKLHILP